jgi:NAD(P)-dependent dehydrogenase (short-subunit alcohol dehydrogenase family)
MLMQTSNPVALVTGASRGLGRTVAGVLAGRGWDLVINARAAGPLAEAAGAFRARGARVVPIEGDIADGPTRHRLLEAARTLGGLNLLVNNASELGPIGRLVGFDAARFGRLFAVNAGAPLALARQAMPLLAGRGGLIVNVTSDAARGAYAGWGPYGATKAALELLSRTLAVELDGTGVSVALVDPGDMRTRMQQEARPGEDLSDCPLPEVTAPFWNWLVDQDPESIRGERFEAQREDSRWLVRA